MQLWEGPNLFALTREKRQHVTRYFGSVYDARRADQRYEAWVALGQTPATPGVITTSRIARLWEFQCGSCYLCLEKFTDTRTATREHVMPKALGGTNDRNILLACSQCNNDKADRPPTQRELDLCAAFYALDAAASDD